MASRSGLIIAGVSTTVGIVESIITYALAEQAVAGGPFRLRFPPFIQLAATFLILSVFGYLTGVMADHAISYIEQKRLQAGLAQGDPEAIALAQAQSAETAAAGFSVKPVRLPLRPITDQSIVG